jgi:ABC-type glycerol-3-phosphate transport system substrate-binding protein
MISVKKKLVFAAIMTAFLLLVASGCAQGDSTQQANTGGDKAAVAPEKHDPVTISMNLIPAYVEVFHTYIDPIIQQKYPYITLEYLEAKPALPDRVAAGDIPDIVMQNGSLRQAMDLNLNYDLTSLVKKHNFDLTKLDPDLLKSVLAYGPKGELFALPSDRSVRALLYNKDIFDKFNVPYPKDAMKWEEAIALSKRLTRTDGGVQYHGLILGTRGVRRFGIADHQSGVRRYSHRREGHQHGASRGAGEDRSEGCRGEGEVENNPRLFQMFVEKVLNQRQGGVKVDPVSLASGFHRAESYLRSATIQGFI